VPPSRNVSLHIGAKPGQLASSVLLPGDPLRGKWIADSYLTDVEQYTAVRGMLGFTGRYRGLRISVQGSGMGQPSLAIYVQELFADYGVDTIVRVGSCGALTADLPVRSVVAAASASTDSAMNHWRFRGIAYAPTADFTLLRIAYEIASARGVDLRVGQIAAWDSLYSTIGPC
jgi:purine-nucleoside phosphorylase